MKTLINPIQYLSTDLVEQCFEREVTHFVDKQVTGNGFTTGFGKIRPNLGRVNVLVAPNKEVVVGKRESYFAGKFGHDDNGKRLRVGFVYEGHPLSGDVRDYDLVMYVVDSFYYAREKLKHNIDKLLIDESHSFYTQTDFRYNLKRAHKIIERIDDPETSVTFLTASPLLGFNTTIKIENPTVAWRDINLSFNLRKSVGRLVEKINEGYRVNIFTNQATIAAYILGSAKLKEFDIIAGDKFKTTLFSKNKYTIKKGAKVKIVTSVGFEGWDDLTVKNNAAAFFYMNLKANHSRVLGCNIYQAFGRFRKGSSYNEINILDIGGAGFPFYAVNNLSGKIGDFINSRDDKNEVESPEKKQSKNFEFRYKRTDTKVKGKSLHPYLYMEAVEGKLIIERFEPSIMVHNEKVKIEPNLNTYRDFFKERKINLNEVKGDLVNKSSVTFKWKKRRVENIVYALKNNDFDGLFYEFFFKNFPPSNDTTIEQYERELVNFYIDELETMIKVANGYNFELKEGMLKLIKFYNDFLPINKGDYNHKEKFISMHEEHMIRKDWKYERKRKERSKFKEFGLVNIIKLAKQMVFKEKSSNYIVHRDYNSFTPVGMTTIKSIADMLEVKVLECDISKCFSRVLYALNGLPIPENFYDIEGMNRQAVKTLKNTAINDFWYDKKKKSPKKEQKRKAKIKFKKLDFHPKVIDYLLENWFETDYKGDLFNYLSYHEQNIISNARRNIENELRNNYIQYNDLDKFKEDIFIVRRHDSLVIFYRHLNLKIDSLNDFEYEGQKGWF